MDGGWIGRGVGGREGAGGVWWVEMEGPTRRVARGGRVLNRGWGVVGAHLVLPAEVGDVAVELGLDLAPLLLEHDELLVDETRHLVVVPAGGEGGSSSAVEEPGTHAMGETRARAGRAPVVFDLRLLPGRLLCDLSLERGDVDLTGEGRGVGGVSRAGGVGLGRPRDVAQMWFPSRNGGFGSRPRTHPLGAHLGVVHQREALLHVETLGPGEALASNRRKNHRDSGGSVVSGRRVGFNGGSRAERTRRDERTAAHVMLRLPGLQGGSGEGSVLL